MKRKHPERPERRHPRVEPNLTGHAEPQSPVGRRGCASLLGRTLMLVLVALVVAAGLR